MELYIIKFFENLWQLLNMVSIYIVFGLLVAGILKQLIPEDFVKKQLGTNSTSAIVKSAIFGIPLPLCSCSVIPFATALKKDGASKSSLQTFLIATPITGADSIFATWATFGGVFTIYRVFSSLVIALAAGFATLIFDNEKPSNSLFSTKKPQDFSLLLLHVNPKKLPKKPFFQRVYSYAFETLLKDIAKPFLIGTIMAALITTFFPDTLPSFIQDSTILSYLAMICISLPLYVCATASIPLGISFIISGFSPGAVFVFLTAGPSSNMITMLVIRKLLGNKSLVIYLATLVCGTFFFGLMLDYFFQNDIYSFIKQTYEEEHGTILNIISTIILLVLSFNIIKKEYARR